MVELIAVIVIVGILAVLGFFGYRTFIAGARDVDAQQSLTAAAAQEVSFAREWGGYTDYVAELKPVSGGAGFTNGDSTAPDQISVTLGSAGSLGLAVKSSTGTCVYVRVTPLLSGGDSQAVTPTGNPACHGRFALGTEAPQSYPAAPAPVRY